MSRKIRRVPANWKHPKEITNGRYGSFERYVPLLDGDYTALAAQWDQNKLAWEQGEFPDGYVPDKNGVFTFEEWNGGRPIREHYVPYDVNGELPWWQMYETTTEGTPRSPAFATADKLVDFLVEDGEQNTTGAHMGPWSRERAEQFVKEEGWFPSMVFLGGESYTAKTGYPK
jgi:hypothetical protein